MDATEIDRIAATIERYGERFIQRLFTDEEIAYCRRKRDSVSSFAARFAAKEAAMKALGTGHSRGVLLGFKGPSQRVRVSLSLSDFEVPLQAFSSRVFFAADR